MHQYKEALSCVKIQILSKVVKFPSLPNSKLVLFTTITKSKHKLWVENVKHIPILTLESQCALKVQRDSSVLKRCQKRRACLLRKSCILLKNEFIIELRNWQLRATFFLAMFFFNFMKQLLTFSIYKHNKTSRSLTFRDEQYKQSIFFEEKG